MPKVKIIVAGPSSALRTRLVWSLIAGEHSAKFHKNHVLHSYVVDDQPIDLYDIAGEPGDWPEYYSDTTGVIVIGAPPAHDEFSKHIRQIRPDVPIASVDIGHTAISEYDIGDENNARYFGVRVGDPGVLLGPVRWLLEEAKKKETRDLIRNESGLVLVNYPGGAGHVYDSLEQALQDVYSKYHIEKVDYHGSRGDIANAFWICDDPEGKCNKLSALTRESLERIIREKCLISKIPIPI